MSKYKAVIDTNIVFAGLYSATGASYQILRLIEKGIIMPYISTSLLFEYEEVLIRNKEELMLTTSDIEEILNSICKMSEQRKIHFLWRPQLPDPKDDHILDLAVTCNNADIVTFNIKHFAPASNFGIRVIKPKQLLEELK
jgi:putative PIN family toxin of toxin-antitoxin system